VALLSSDTSLTPVPNSNIILYFPAEYNYYMDAKFWNKKGKSPTYLWAYRLSNLNDKLVDIKIREYYNDLVAALYESTNLYIFHVNG
jgi:hypothetical protein